MQGPGKIMPRQFKVIRDKNKHIWVKEKVNPSDPSDNQGYRHHIHSGPKGGKYFTGRDGKKRYINSISLQIYLEQGESLGSLPPEGSVPWLRNPKSSPDEEEEIDFDFMDLSELM